MSLLNIQRARLSTRVFGRVPSSVVLLLLGVAAVLSGSQAALANGEMAAPRLSSDASGELTVSWDTPSPAPNDYRLMWAPEGSGWLSYRDENETERGNLYPGGGETSLTISGLTPGSTYKVKMRARYGPGNSGPWSAEATLRVVTPAAPDKDGKEQDRTSRSNVGPRNTTVTLIGNTGQTDGQTGGVHFTHAQAFSTGSNSAGYKLTGIDIKMANTSDATPKFTVAIYDSNSSNEPGTSLGTLSKTSVLVDNSVNSWTNTSGIDLAAGTTYFMVLDGTGVTGTTGRLQNTASDSEDSGGASGWSIADSSLYKGPTDTSWTSFSESKMMAVKGYAKAANRAPVFSSTTVSLSIAENTARNQEVGSPVTATDADGDTLAYSLRGTHSTSFSIGSATGQIYSFSRLDHEGRSSYSVTVRASDGKGGTATANVTINVTDVDEPPSAPAAPAVGPVLGSANSVRVSWTAPGNSGKPPITSYDLRYRQGTSGSWKDGPQDQTGTSATISGLTASATHQVQVRATSHEGNSPWSAAGSGIAGRPSATLISNVGQTQGSAIGLHSDFAQAFTTGSNGTGYKLTGVDLRLAGTDDAAPDITITIHESDSSDRPGTSLATLSRTAALADNAVNSWTTASDIDLAASTTYFIYVNGDGTSSDNDGSLRITGSNGEDSGGASGWSIDNDSLTKTQSASSWTEDGSSVMVAVRGYAKNRAPVFNPSTVTRSVAENTAANQDVGSPVTATDADTGDTLTYSLGGDDAASFTIVSSSGQIRTRSGVTYDHEARSSYSVTVTASDNRGGTATADVTITITDVDEPPSTPAAPAVAAVPGFSTYLQVSWSAPANTGPPIEYELRYREGASGSWTDGPQDLTSTTAFIRSLTADTAYQVQVRARSDEGDSGWSAAGSGATNNDPGAATSSSRCPNGGFDWLDFRRSQPISDLVAFGDPATGTLNARHCGDFLRFTGLEKGRTYRVTVDFAGAGSVGGSIKVFTRGSSGQFDNSIGWDSNFDGNAIVDFDVPDHPRYDPSDFYLRVDPTTGLGAKATHVGDYSVTLTDISDIQYLVGNIRGLTNTVTFFGVGRDAPQTESPDKNHLAQSFTTGAHSDGYLLDRIAVYITMEQTDSLDVSGDSDARPSIAIHRNSSGIPGMKLCDLALPLDYDSGLNFTGTPTGLVLADNIEAGDCANHTLAASTTYWVVFGEQATSTPYKAYHVVAARDANEDVLGAAGWSMGNNLAINSVTSSNIWGLHSASPIALGIMGREK